MNTPSRVIMARRDRFRPAGPPTPSGRPRRGGARRRVSGLWKHGPIPVVGLVGGIGAGKSAVAEALARRGAFVLDADRVGHALLDQRPARDRIVRRFGPEILAPLPEPTVEDTAGPPSEDDTNVRADADTVTDTNEDSPNTAKRPPRPSIDRRALGEIVFADSSARRDLEAILHPRMRATFERAIDRTIRRGGFKAIVLDAAVLFEAHWEDLCDLVLFVDAPTSQRLARVQASRGWSAADLAAREAAQLPLDVKQKQADVVLINDSTPEALDERVGQLWARRLSARARRHPFSD